MPINQPSLAPTRKWWAALITGLLTIVAHAVASGEWNSPEWAELFTLLSGLTVAYLVPNNEVSVRDNIKERVN